MNAPVSLKPVVRTADLSLPSDLAAIHAFLEGRSDATPFHRLEWQQGVSKGLGHTCRYLIAETGGTVSGVLPLTEVRSPLFGRAQISSGFAVGGGILADTGDAAEALAAEAIRIAEATGCPSIELRGGPVPQGWHVHAGSHATFARDLPASEDAILTAIPRKQRAEVRKALASDLIVEINRNAAAHYGVYAESYRNLGTPIFPRAFTAAMLDAFGDDADVLTVRYGSKAVASVISLYDRGTVYPYFGGGTREARALRANELMYFALMRHAASRGCTRFDFGRSKVDSGPYAFKKNWGFTPVPVSHACWGERRDTNPNSPKYRAQIALWQRLPLWLANSVGPPIARGLG